jgi:hypothetical protein
MREKQQKPNDSRILPFEPYGVLLDEELESVADYLTWLRHHAEYFKGMHKLMTMSALGQDIAKDPSPGTGAALFRAFEHAAKFGITAEEARQRFFRAGRGERDLDVAYFEAETILKMIIIDPRFASLSSKPPQEPTSTSASGEPKPKRGRRPKVTDEAIWNCYYRLYAPDHKATVIYELVAKELKIGPRTVAGRIQKMKRSKGRRTLSVDAAHDAGLTIRRR